MGLLNRICDDDGRSPAFDVVLFSLIMDPTSDMFDYVAVLRPTVYELVPHVLHD